MLLSDLLHDWHDYYLLAGTASATLVGLMFVAASIGASIFNEEYRPGMKAFLSPTVVHFSAVLVISLLLTVPIHRWSVLGGLLGVGGFLGTAYSARILVQIVIRQKFKVDLLDRLFYALLPVTGYVLVLVSAVLLLVQAPAAVAMIAIAVLVLLLAAIRNAWDMTIWIAIRAPSSGPRETSPPPPAS